MFTGWRARILPTLKALEKSSRQMAKSGMEYVNSANGRFNRLTGYEVIEARKESVLAKDRELHDIKRLFKECKERYETLIDERRSNQKELDGAKERKTSLEDISRITELYKKQLSLESAEEQAKSKYKWATDVMERVQIEYLNEMRERYVEEQMYSDKIRRASTYWTIGLMGIHLLLFLTVQFVVEPRKRQDLQNRMEKMLKEYSQSDRLAFESLLSQFASTAALTSSASPDLPLLASHDPVQLKSTQGPDGGAFIGSTDSPLSVSDGPNQIAFWKDVQFYQGYLGGILFSLACVYLL